MVRDTENPSFLLASCCRVDVVNGGAGDFLPGFTCTSLTVKSESLHALRISRVFSTSFGFREYSALTAFPLPVFRSACILKADSGVNLLISRSLSTTSLTATDCTRPADNEGLIFFHKSGDRLKPTRRSSTRRAC